MRKMVKSIFYALPVHKGLFNDAHIYLRKRLTHINKKYDLPEATLKALAQEACRRSFQSSNKKRISYGLYMDSLDDVIDETVVFLDYQNNLSPRIKNIMKYYESFRKED